MLCKILIGYDSIGPSSLCMSRNPYIYVECPVAGTAVSKRRKARGLGIVIRRSHRIEDFIDIANMLRLESEASLVMRTSADISCRRL